MMSVALRQQHKVEQPEIPSPPPTPAPAPADHYARALARHWRAVLFAAPALATVLAYGAGLVAQNRLRPQPVAAVAAAESEPDGVLLYAQHCATCHGERGDGNGTTLLDPRARYFGYEKFKLA